MSIRNSLAGLAVCDIDAAICWYERLLSRPPDQQPMSEVAEWGFPRGGWIQVFQDEERAGKSSVTLSVSDLETEVQRLRDLPVPIGEIQHSTQVKTAILQDPDGNQLVFAEPLTDEIAQ